MAWFLGLFKSQILDSDYQQWPFYRTHIVIAKRVSRRKKVSKWSSILEICNLHGERVKGWKPVKEFSVEGGDWTKFYDLRFPPDATMQPRWHPKSVVSKWLRSKATCRIPFLYNVFDFRVEPHSRNFYSFDLEIPHFHVHFYGFQRIPWQIHLPWPSLICCASAMGFRIRLIYSGKQMRRLDLMNFGQFVHCWTWSERWKTHEQVVSWRFLVMGNERKVIVWLSVTLPCKIFRWWVWVSDHFSTFFPSSLRWCQAWHTVSEIGYST